MTTSLAQRAQVMLQLTRFLLLALIAVITAWTLWIAPSSSGNAVTIWLIQALPLACFIPGIFLAKPRTHIWLCFVILVYFCSGVMLATSFSHSGLGLLQSFLSAALFSTAMMYVRWNGQATKQAAQAE